MERHRALRIYCVLVGAMGVVVAAMFLTHLATGADPAQLLLPVVGCLLMLLGLLVFMFTEEVQETHRAFMHRRGT